MKTRIRVYDKKRIGLEEEHMLEMFSLLKEDVAKSDIFRLRKEHAALFEVFGDDKLSKENEKLLLSALNNLSLKSIDKGNFTSLREILEAIFCLLHKIKPDLFPLTLFKDDGRPNLEYWVRYLHGRQINAAGTIIHPQVTHPRAPGHIACTIEYIKNTTSILSHTYSPNWSTYAYKSCVFGLCEVLLWLNKDYFGDRCNGENL
ncbi:MAG: hypothetical protein EOO43_07600 [Flavobacterium sp.]|nr:MAG: hypothetical protein EOO43_07600 [Flavobacterium sp.]